MTHSLSLSSGSAVQPSVAGSLLRASQLEPSAGLDSQESRRKPAPQACSGWWQLDGGPVVVALTRVPMTPAPAPSPSSALCPCGTVRRRSFRALSRLPVPASHHPACLWSRPWCPGLSLAAARAPWQCAARPGLGRAGLAPGSSSADTQRPKGLQHRCWAGWRGDRGWQGRGTSPRVVAGKSQLRVKLSPTGTCSRPDSRSHQRPAPARESAVPRPRSCGGVGGHRQDGRGHRAGSGVDSATSGLGRTRAPTLSEPRVRTAPRAGMGVSGTHSPAHAHLRTRGPTHACLHTRTCTHLYHTVQRPVWAIARSVGTFVTGRLVSVGHLCNYFKSGTLSQRSWGWLRDWRAPRSDSTPARLRHQRSLAMVSSPAVPNLVAPGTGAAVRIRHLTIRGGDAGAGERLPMPPVRGPALAPGVGTPVLGHHIRGPSPSALQSQV